MTRLIAACAALLCLVATAQATGPLKVHLRKLPLVAEQRQHLKDKHRLVTLAPVRFCAASNSPCMHAPLRTENQAHNA